MLPINTVGASTREAAELLRLKDNVGTGTNRHGEARNKLGKKLEKTIL